MTENDDAMQTRVPHSGYNSVLLGNGDSLTISQTDSIPLTLGSHNFRLNNVYHVPSMRKNLLSVAKFTRDNSICFSFDPFGYIISHLKMSVPLFQG